MCFCKTAVPFFIQPSLVCFCSPTSTSFSHHLHIFLPPSVPLFFLSASGITIKSFTGLSHPMNRVMRICLLNWNSHLLPPRLRPALFSPPSSFIALSFILVSSVFSLLPFLFCGLNVFIFNVHISLNSIVSPPFSYLSFPDVVCSFNRSCVYYWSSYEPPVNHKEDFNINITGKCLLNLIWTSFALCHHPSLQSVLRFILICNRVSPACLLTHTRARGLSSCLLHAFLWSCFSAVAPSWGLQSLVLEQRFSALLFF